MTKLIDLPSEVLFEICLNVFLISGSEAWAEYTIDPTTGEHNPAAQNRVDLVREYCNSRILTNTFVCNSDALYSCQGTLMIQVYEGITLVRCPHKNILPLSLTCKRLHEIVEALLWCFVETDQESKGAIGDLVRILSTILKRPELGRHTKVLAFRHFYLDDDSSPFSADETKEMKTILEWDTSHQVAALLDHLPNLRAMKLAIETQPDYFSVFRPSTLYTSGFPLGLQNLTEFSFHWEDPDGESFSAEMLLPLFLLPNLKTLYLGHIAAEGNREDLHDFTRYYGTSTITTLIIDFAIVEEAAITAYLKLPKRLERFEYTYDSGSNRVSNAEPEEYLRALLPQKDSLTTLKIRGCREIQTFDSEEAPDPHIIRSFTLLTEYAFPLSLMLFLDPDAPNTHYRLEEILPPNVQYVAVHAYDDWSFDGVNDLLKSFFSFGKVKFPSLRKMKLEIWLQEDDYTLHAPKGRKSEAIGVITSRVQSLKQRAKDKGATLRVDLDTLSAQAG